ncbi:tape measure protein [Achromobacter insolitus]|uniref:tape measure protein n=1 Tax=Achromobacter insolitus TaxID=217204 RepID=UPI0028AA2259|nr:tape measure protein [Achromobacter insolitus]
MTIARELVTLLRYQVDESGLKKYQGSYQAAREGMGKASGQMVQSMRQAVAGSGLSGLVARARSGLGTVREVGAGVWEGVHLGINDARQAQQRLTRSQWDGTRAVKEQASAYEGLRNIIGAYLGFSLIKRIGSDVDAWGQLEARMRQATASAQEYGEVDKDLARISRLTYKAYADNAELFVRTRRTMADLGKSTQDTVDVTEGLSLGMALSSTKAQDQESVISALTAAIMQGKLGMEQYATLMRAAPRLQVALADGLGLTTDKLLEQVKAGKVTTNQFLPALQTQLAKMRVEAEAMPVTIADAMTVWNDAFQRFFGQMSLARASVTGVTKIIETLADNIGTVIKLLALVGGAWGLVALRNWLRLVTFQSGGLIRSLRGATRAAIGLDSAMALRRGPAGAMRMLAMWNRSLAPLLRMAAILYSIYLLVDDIGVWFRGGDSVFGDLIGPVEEWKGEIQAVKNFLTQIKDLLGGAGQALGPWVTKWGTIAVLLYGILAILSPIRGVITFLALRAIPMLWAAFAAHPVGRVISLILGGLLLVWQNWDRISKFFGETWEEFKAKGKAALDGLLGFFEDLGGRMIAKVKEIGNAIQTWITDKVEAAAKWLKELLPGQMLTDDQKALMTGPRGALAAQPQWQAFMSGTGVPMVSPGAAVRAGAGGASGPAQVDIHNEVTIHAPGADPNTVAGATRRGLESTQSRSIDRMSRIFGIPMGVEVAP